jgi:hypothetical protein
LGGGLRRRLLQFARKTDQVSHVAHRREGVHAREGLPSGSARASTQV